MSNETASCFPGEWVNISRPCEPCNRLNAGASGSQAGILGWLTSGAEEPLIAALRSFQLSLQYNEKQLAEPAVLDIAGHRIQEAQSWDDFKRLAQVSIPTQGKEPLSGVLLHGLLVTERVRPKHSFHFQFLEKVMDLLCKRYMYISSFGRQPGENWRLTSQEETPPELFPLLALYSLLVHHLRLWQDMTREEVVRVDTNLNLSMQAIDVLRLLLASGIVVDTLHVFCWLSNHLALGLVHQSSYKMVLDNALGLLIDMVELHQQSEQISAELHRAAALMVKGSLSCAVPCGSIFHCAVVKPLPIVNLGRYPRQQTSLAKDRKSHLMKLIRILLDEGSSDLVNLVNDSNETAAHEVISVAKEGFSFRTYMDKIETFQTTAMELLTLFDEYGQHWDSFYNSRHSLLEMLTMIPELSSFWTQLLCQPRTLQCLSATVAVTWCDSEVWKGLPENIKQIVLQHQRATPPTPSWSSPEDLVSPYSDFCESRHSSSDMFLDGDDDGGSMESFLS